MDTIRALAFACLALVALTPSAHADDIGPEDEVRIRECTLEHQQSGGARCVECRRSVGSEARCTAPVDGLELRCVVGAAHRRELWCSGPPPSAESEAPRLAYACVGLGAMMILGGAAGIAWSYARRRR